MTTLPEGPQPRDHLLRPHRHRIPVEIVTELRARFAAGEGITTLARQLHIEEAYALRIATGQVRRDVPVVNVTRRVLRPHVRRGEEHPLHGRPELRARGEAHGCAKLDEASVRAIRRRAGESARALAREFGVAPVTIARVRCRVNWRHVT